MSEKNSDRRSMLYFLLAIFVGVAFTYLPLGLNPVVQKAVGVTLYAIVLFIAEPIPLAMSGLTACLAYVIFGVSKFGTAFAGFAQSTTWFIFGAMLIGTMVAKSGLATRMALHILSRARSYKMLVGGMLFLNFLLTFLVPSGVARVVILCTICLGMVNALGYDKNSNIARGLFCGCTFAAALFDKGILAGGSAMLSHGAIEKATGVSILYSQWMLCFVPFDVIIITAVWLALLKIFPAEDASLHLGSEYIANRLKEMGSFSTDEKKALIIALGATLVWMTDFWHHISPATIGLAAGMIACIPGIGILKEEDLRKVNFLMVIFVGAAISIGEVMITSGAADAMANAMFAWLKPWIAGGGPLAWGILYVYNFVLHILMGSELSVIAATMPPLLKFAKEVGLDPIQIGLVWNFAVGAKLFIYESGPLVAGYAFGYFTTKDMFKLAGTASVIQFFVIVWLPYWWKIVLG